MIIDIEHIAKNAIDMLLEDAVSLTEDRAQPVGEVQLEKSIDNLIKKIYDKTKTTDEGLKTKFWNANRSYIDIDLATVKNKINIDDFNANLDIYMPHMHWANKRQVFTSKRHCMKIFSFFRKILFKYTPRLIKIFLLRD
mgnify:CR=1 FL=1